MYICVSYAHTHSLIRSILPGHRPNPIKPQWNLPTALTSGHKKWERKNSENNNSEGGKIWFKTSSTVNHWLPPPNPSLSPQPGLTPVTRSEKNVKHEGSLYLSLSLFWSSLCLPFFILSPPFLSFSDTFFVLNSLLVSFLPPFTRCFLCLLSPFHILLPVVPFILFVSLFMLLFPPYSVPFVSPLFSCYTYPSTFSSYSSSSFLSESLILLSLSPSTLLPPSPSPALQPITQPDSLGTLIYREEHKYTH